MLKRTLLVFFWLVFCLVPAMGQEKTVSDKLDSLKVAAKSTTDKELVDIYNDISWRYRNIEIDSSLFYGQKAYNLSIKIGYPLGISKSLNFIGVAKRNLSNYLGALENFFDALKHAEQSRNLIQISYSLINIGNIYVFQTNYEGAIEYFEKALINADKLEDNDLKAYCHVNLGRSYTGLKQFDKAEDHLNQAVSLRMSQNNNEGRVITQVDLANLYILSGKLDEAESLILDTLLDEIIALGHKTTLAYCYLILSKIYHQKNQLSRAENIAKKGLKVCKDNEIKNEEGDFLNQLALIYESSKDYKKSLRYHQMFIANKDSIFNEENIRKIESLHTSYQAEKKEVENRYLKQQSELNTIIITRQKIIIWLAVFSAVLFCAFGLISYKASQDRKKMTVQIEKQKEEAFRHNNSLIDLNHEKNNLIRILSHDLRSPINNIKGLTQLHQSSNSEVLSDSDNEMLDHVVGESDRLLAMITKILNVEALDQETKNYKSDRINVSYIVKQVLDNYEKAAQLKKIKIAPKLGSFSVHILGDQIRFRQVVENLISNAIKFSQPNTQIQVSVVAINADKKVQISVKDQGPGFTDDDMTKLFHKFQPLSAKPTGNEQSTGLGLSIVKQYVEQMEGRVHVDSTWGKGTTFKVEFYIV